MVPSRYETLGNKEEHTDLWATRLCGSRRSKGIVKKVTFKLYVHTHRANSDAHVPGSGPSVPQQLKDGHLFGGEVSPQEVNSIFRKVRRDD